MPLVGVIRAIALSKVSRRIRDRLRPLGIMTVVEAADAEAELGIEIFVWQEKYMFYDIGIVDDGVYVYVGEACRIVDVARSSAEVVFVRLSAYRVTVASEEHENVCGYLLAWSG